MNHSGKTLPIIVVAQFLCTSLWFATNAVLDSLVAGTGIATAAVADLTSAVQLGFIVGTLVFAVLTIADRFSPARVFFGCAVLGALGNAALTIGGLDLSGMLALRFVVGFFLAGIYPVGMKIAADYFQTGLGRSLGLLVGALVLGTAFPHLLRALFVGLPWQPVLYATSTLALMGGTAMLLVPDGPYRIPGTGVDLAAFFRVFRDGDFRAAAFGYFGHMWELYTFWAFVPVILQLYLDAYPSAGFSVALWSFFIIGIGGVGCFLSGQYSARYDTKRLAYQTLFASGVCCLLMPLVFHTGSVPLFLLFLLFWGAVVVADSPLFATLVAQNAHPTLRGTALTIVNCVGFAITIVSLQVVSYLYTSFSTITVFVLLAGGPLLGLLALRQKASR